jgi:hypothetical protein
VLGSIATNNNIIGEIIESIRYRMSMLKDGLSNAMMTMAPPSAFTAYPTYGPAEIYDDFEFIDLPATAIAATQSMWGNYAAGQVPIMIVNC